MAILVQDLFNLTDPPGPSGLITRSIALQRMQSYDGPLPFNNSTRPAEFPDPNTVNNTAVNPVLVLSPAPTGLPFQGSQLANKPKAKPVVGTS